MEEQLYDLMQDFVLILVLMEKGGSFLMPKAVRQHKRVLILVLMEKGGSPAVTEFASGC